MVNFNFSLRKATHVEHRHFWLPVATAGRGKPRQTDRHPSGKRRHRRCVATLRHAEANSNYTGEVYKTHGSTSMGWDTFSILASSFFACGQVTGLFCWVFLCLALDCIVLWEFEILYRAELSNPARNCHIFPGFSSFDFWPAVGCGPCSGRCFLRFSVLGASFGVEDDYSRFSALPSIFYVCFIYLFPRIFGSIRLYRAVWYSQLGPWFCWWQFISGRPLWSTCCDLTDQNIKGFSNHIILS